MKITRLRSSDGFFKPLTSSRSVQTAAMILRSGQSSSEAVENEHPAAEQWLFVVSGSGRAMVGRKRRKLKPGDLLLIERREPHQITNTGRRPLVTLNFYSPPAYTAEGEVRPSVKR